MTERSVYVKGVPIEQALARMLELMSGPDRTESIAVTSAVGRITAQAVFAARSVPHYPASAMDGIAVRSADTAGASDTTPIRLTMGTDCIVVDTGDELPAGFDAVIMSEVVRRIDDSAVEIDAAASPWQHVRPIGEDMVAGDLILAQGSQIRPIDLGALLAGGITTLAVRPRPRVVIIPTGDELITPEQAGSGEPPAGAIVETNSAVIAALLISDGAEPEVCPIVPDEPRQVCQALQRAHESDASLILVNAGSSAGRGDFVPGSISATGTLLGQGLAIKPGKPASFGFIGSTPVVGLPGYPVSTVTVYSQLVRPLLARLLNTVPAEPPVVQATLTRHLASSMGVDEYLRVRLGSVDGRTIAVPLGRGAGATMSLVRADGTLRIPPDSEGLAEGTTVTVRLNKPWDEILRTLLVVGSHDLSLDIIDDILRSTGSHRLQSAAVGSLGGIIALSRGEAHLAGTHLLDEPSGEFNIPFVRRHLPDRPVLLLAVAERTQGLITAVGNPLNIRSVRDIADRRLPFVNRQRGSGTRLLLDKLLREQGVDPRSIVGYDREEYTHTGVAAAVRANTAACGLGILAPAQAMGLDFVPLTGERFELAIPEQYIELEPIQAVIETVSSGAFKRRLTGLGGYDTRVSGHKRWAR